MKLDPIAPGERARLADSDARARGDLPEGDALEAAARKQTDRISDLQRVLYADARHALLIVLQGRDASGKDGTIRKVFTAVNPQGCEVTSFKAPTEAESRHDFLWRVHARIPALGMIGIFNRSHYEDVIVPRVHGDMKKKEWLARYDRINDFERLLTESGVVVLKFLLHISRDEQKQRLTDRLTDKTKNWKFRAGDLDDRALWSEYTKAYRSILEHTSTEDAPWFVVPADDNDTRDYLVARTIADALDDLDLRYPRASKDVLGLKVD
ncbi:MAG TPA: PPK2 family polyphosphate kinase [Gemmatimonadaceae bacterium]|nr:PPK2 family polyphosphate kinase [Gemmatimonadaceae bacterium]